jgi:hypothetical protein
VSPTKQARFSCPQALNFTPNVNDLRGEPAGTRTQDQLIKSFPVAAFSLAKSMMAVANFKAGYLRDVALKERVWQP